MRKYLSIILLIALLVVQTPFIGHAQDDALEVVPISTAAENLANGLQLRTLFIVRDKASGRVIPTTRIENAKFQLPNDDAITPADLQTPTTPIKIALLLDESGSMQPFIAGVRNAAKDAISKAPEQAQFAIFKFSDVSSTNQIAPDLNFTPKSDSATINNFIDTQYDSRTEAPTCLYNITLQATRYLAQNTGPDERRAIILFTDGKDERLDGSQCSDRSLDDVTKEADPDSNTPTPIYTVGLCTTAACDKIDKAVLDRMSSQTKAISRVDTQDKLAGLFYDIMDDLKAQKLAQATIAPCEEQQATLLVQLVDTRDPIRAIVPFSNTKCYTPRATISINEPQPNATDNTYTFPATISNLSPLALQSLSVQVIDPNNTTVYTETLQDPQFQVASDQQQNVMIPIQARSMVTPGDYIIRITGLAQDGIAFLNQTPLANHAAQVLGELSFKHTLSADVQIAISSVRPNDELTAITVTVQIVHKDIIDPANLRFLQYQGKIFKDNTEVDSFGPTSIDLTNTEDSFVLQIPLSDRVRTITSDTDYKIAITLLAPPDARRGTGPQSYTSNEQPFQLTPPPTKTFWQRLGPVLLSPFVLIGVAVIILVLIGAVVYAKIRAQRVIPRPFNSATMIMPAAARPSTPQAPASNQTPPTPTPITPVAPIPAPVEQRAAPSAPATPARPAVNATPAQPTVNPAIINRPAPNATQIEPGPSDPTMLHVDRPAPPRQPRVYIKIVKTIDPGQLREETIGLPCMIGRENVHVTISGDPKISRAHAEIKHINGQLVITDRNSSNGTFVNNVRLEKGASIPLTGPTTVRLGPNTVLEVAPKG